MSKNDFEDLDDIIAELEDSLGVESNSYDDDDDSLGLTEETNYDFGSGEYSEFKDDFEHLYEEQHDDF